MLQGFETKSANATKNYGGQRQPRQVADSLLSIRGQG